MQSVATQTDQSGDFPSIKDNNFLIHYFKRSSAEELKEFIPIAENVLETNYKVNGVSENHRILKTIVATLMAEYSVLINADLVTSGEWLDPIKFEAVFFNKLHEIRFHIAMGIWLGHPESKLSKEDINYGNRHYFDAIKIFEENKQLIDQYPDEWFRVHFNVARHYLYQNKLDDALKYSLIADEISKKYEQINNAYLWAHNYIKALILMQLSIKHANSALKHMYADSYPDLFKKWTENYGKINKIMAQKLKECQASQKTVI